MRSFSFSQSSSHIALLSLAASLGFASVSYAAPAPATPSQIISVQFASNQIASNGYTAGVLNAGNFNSDTTNTTNFATETTGLNGLIDSTGATTTINETKTDFGNYGPNGQEGDPVNINVDPTPQPDFANPGDNSLYDHGVFGDYGGTDLTLNLSGLDPTLSYTLYLYTRGVQGYSRPSVTATNTDNSTTYQFTADGNNSFEFDRAGDPPTMTNTSGDANYVEFDGLTGSATLSATLSNADGLTLDGFQLAAAPAAATGVPEPTSLGLLAIGGMALVKRRRRV